jgi:hypothetical protein
MLSTIVLVGQLAVAQAAQPAAVRLTPLVRLVGQPVPVVLYAPTEYLLALAERELTAVLAALL